MSCRPDGKDRSRLYLPTGRPIRGAWLISPGLHYNGPDDPRMDRLASVLAAAGNVVLSPASHDLMLCRITPSVIQDLRQAFDWFVRTPEIRSIRDVRLLSVSVGSLAALRLASSAGYAERVSSIFSFGGYADARCMLSSLVTGTSGEDERQPGDPLNQPVVFMTLVDHLPGIIQDKTGLCNAWRAYIHRTWPFQELKRPDSTEHTLIARDMASQVNPTDRELFLTGCGANHHGRALCKAALESADGYYEFLDPLPDATQLRARVHLVHGVKDPVIPYSELASLKKAIPHARTYSLRAYAHSALLSWRKILTDAPHLAGDAVSLVRIVRALA